VKFNLVGSTFGNDACATHGKVSQHIEWDRTRTPQSGTFHVDHAIFSPQLSMHTKECSYGWILESEAIIPQVYKHAPKVLDNFEVIFTHSAELLAMDERFIFAPVGTHWIKRPRVPQMKTKLVSMVSSRKTMCAGHHERLGWVEKLRHGVDLYGRGFNEIECKETALEEYMFSVAIENCQKPNYFTEKIGDCFATGTIPIYLGCPNIGDFFNMDGIIVLDDNFSLEDLSYELYLSKLPAVKENFEKIAYYEIPEDYIFEHYFK